MRTYPINHVAALELAVLNQHDQVPGMAGLGDDLSDASDQIAAAEQQYASDESAAQSAGVYDSRALNFKAALENINRAQALWSEWQASPDNVTAGYNLTNIVANLNAAYGYLAPVEAMLNQQQQAPAVAAAQPASEYTYSSPEFVGPPAPNVKAQPPVQVTVSVGGAVVPPPGATSGTWTTPGGTVAPQYAAIVQNNPSVALVPQTGTTPVPVTNQNMQSLMSLLTQGANAFTSSQILSVLAHASLQAPLCTCLMRRSAKSSRRPRLRIGGSRRELAWLY